MKNKFLQKVSLCLFSLYPMMARADVEGSLHNIHNELVGRLLPIAAILGFVFAGFSYITGNANARNHLILAIIGAGIGFGASSILSLIQSLVN